MTTPRDPTIPTIPTIPTEPFRVGQQYRTQAGNLVTCIRVNDHRGYETAQFSDLGVDEHGTVTLNAGWRYNRVGDRGRVTASAFDWSDPGNVFPEPAVVLTERQRYELLEAKAKVVEQSECLSRKLMLLCFDTIHPPTATPHPLLGRFETLVRHEAFLEAAMLLRPEGYNWSLDGLFGRHGCVMNKTVIAERAVFLDGMPTAAHAVLVACLRARAKEALESRS